MLQLAHVRQWLRALVARRRVDAELDEELRFHVEMATAERAQHGMSPAEARTQALRDFGGLERFKEDCRDVRGTRLLTDFAQDVRYALRTLRKSPGFTTVVVLTLALAIGANTAIFSVVNGVLLRPLPYAHPGQLVMVWEADRFSGTTREDASVPDYFDFRARNHVFTDVAAFAEQPLTLTRAGAEPQHVVAGYATRNLFPLLGVTPILGRAFTPGEGSPGGPRAVVLSEALWRNRFGADPGILGSTIRLDDLPYTVVGVLPAGMAIPSKHTDLWVPAQIGPTTRPRYNHVIAVIGRLRDGITVAAAQREMTDLAAQLEAAYPSNKGRGVHLERLDDVVVGSVRPALVVLLGAVVLVLLVACANVGNLLLARAATRGHEVAVRTALGASVGRLARQFVVESMLISGAAAIAGVAIAAAGLHLLLALAPAELPRVGDVTIDARVLAFTLGLTILVAIGFGVLPMLESRRLQLPRALRSSTTRGSSAGRRHTRLRDALVVSELAVSVALVIGAGLLIRSFWTLRHVNPGFAAQNVMQAELQLPPARYPQSRDTFPKWPEITNFYTQAIDRVSALSGVQSAALANVGPLMPGFTNSFVIEGREAEAARGQAEIYTRMVSPSYFRTVGLPLLQGRALSAHDDGHAPLVAVINQAAAHQYFADATPVGHRLKFWGTWRTIVGVVGNERFQGLTQQTPPAVYTPLMQTPMASLVLLVRTSRDPSMVWPAVRREIASVDPQLALFNAVTMPEALAQSVAQQRFTMLLLGTFATAAMLLALIGVHGVLSYLVAQRTREVGIRMALGASRGAVARLVVGRGALLSLIGIGAGLALAAAGARLLSGLLFGVTALDPATYAVVVFCVAVVALLASLLPARRAMAVDPAIALRSE
ncbi:MAG TPA: ABC transporter permease [Gemmatimonadaceae bacterium]|nr:ABC transporter permease [Gemmatimonadaceae bacterium]